MSVDINYLGVVLATVGTMVVGGVWYAQGVFGKTWAKLTNQKMDGKVTFANMAPLLGIQFVASLVTSYVMAHIMFVNHAFYQDSWLGAGLMTAAFVWLGFTAVRILVHDMFEKRPSALTLLNVSHELVTFLVIGLVLGLVHP